MKKALLTLVALFVLLFSGLYAAAPPPGECGCVAKCCYCPKAKCRCGQKKNEANCCTRCPCLTTE